MRTFFHLTLKSVNLLFDVSNLVLQAVKIVFNFCEKACHVGFLLNHHLLKDSLNSLIHLILGAKHGIVHKSVYDLLAIFLNNFDQLCIFLLLAQLQVDIGSHKHGKLTSLVDCLIGISLDNSIVLSF